MPEMQQNTFGGRAPHGPAAEAYRPPSCNEGVHLRGARKEEGWEEGLLLTGEGGMEKRGEGKGGNGNSSPKSRYVE